MTDGSDFTYLRYHVAEGAAWITIDRPEHRNALCTAAYGEIRQAFRRARHDDGVDVIVTTGTGQDFAVGGDLNEVEAITAGGDRLDFHAFEDNLPYETIRNCPKTTIAMINGNCLGGALALAAAMDLLLASDNARFGLPEARSGYFDPWGPEFLAPRISRTHLNQLVYTGELIDAATALQWGMVNAVSTPDSLHQEVGALIERVRRTESTARTGYKRIITRHDRITSSVAATVGFTSATIV